MFTYLKKWWVIAILFIIILIVIGSIIHASSATAQDTYLTVSTTTVSEGVSVTGNVKSAQAVDLAFVKSGKIISVTKQVGDEVTTGDVVVSLDNADVKAELSQAQAEVALQQAKLDELLKGTRPEELSITSTKLTNATTDFNRSELDLLTALQNAYSSTEDAIHNKADEFLNNPRSYTPTLAFAETVTPPTSIESGRIAVETKLDDMQSILATASTSSDLPAVSTRIKQDVAEAKLYLDNAAFAVNALTPTSYLPQSTVTLWKNDLAAARNEVNTALTSILTADNSYASAQSALSVAQGEYNLEKAGSVSEEIEAQQAQVDAARASVDSTNATLSETYIRAPIDGVVTKQEAKVGQIAQAGVPLVSIMSQAQFQIEANVAEADIAQVAVGEKASVTLDAYGPDTIFQATVVSIDPAETIVDGVPTYKTTFQFDTTDSRIKSGMTANIDIIGETHTNVLGVPQRAIINRSGTKYVRLKEGTKIEEVPVTTGIRGEDGTVEITSGLSEGDVIAISQVSS